MLRAILAIIAGYILWTALWFAGNLTIFAEATEIAGAGERYDKAAPLVGILILSVVCSLAAGLTASLIAGRRPRARIAALILGLLLLLTGIGVQLGVWELMPVWYHLTFLVLLLPVTFAASLLRRAGPKPHTA